MLLATITCRWVKSKTAVEALGSFGGSGSDAHAASLVGARVGSCFKDVASPTMTAVVKMQALTALVVAPLIFIDSNEVSLDLRVWGVDLDFRRSLIFVDADDVSFGSLDIEVSFGSCICGPGTSSPWAHFSIFRHLFVQPFGTSSTSICYFAPCYFGVRHFPQIQLTDFTYLGRPTT